MENINQEKPLEIQIALRLTGDIAEKVKALKEAEERSFAYIAKRLIKEALEKV